MMNQTAYRSLSERIADFACNAKLDSLPPSVIESAKTVLMDVFGVAMTCVELDHARAIRRTLEDLSSSSGCTLWGSQDTASLADAVLYNSCLIHGADYDDTHIAAFVHPSAPVVSVALACGELVKATGREMLEAMVVGWEVIIRLGLATKGRGDDIGFHTTGLLAPFAGACTAARLLGCTKDQLMNALGLCGSQAGALQEFLNTGAQVKKLHPGWGAHSAVYAVLLAKHGLSGPPRVFEGNFGLWQTHFGGTDGLEEAFRDLGESWHIHEIAFKMYPICHDTHSFVDIAIRMRKREGFAAGQIRSVECRIEPRCYDIVCLPLEEKSRPKNDFIMRFSLQYVVAAALLYGCVTPAEIDMRLAADPKLLALIDKVECIPDPEKENPGYLPGWVRVTLEDGSVYTEEQLYEAGSAQNPIDTARVRDKYFANMSHCYTQAQAGRILEIIDHFDTMENAGTLHRELAVRNV